MVTSLDGCLGASRPRFETPEARATPAILPDPRNNARRGGRSLIARLVYTLGVKRKTAPKGDPRDLPVAVAKAGEGRVSRGRCEVCKFMLPADGPCKVCEEAARAAAWLKTPAGQAFHAESEKGRRSVVRARAAGKKWGFAKDEGQDGAG